jgi:endonuclease III
VRCSALLQDEVTRVVREHKWTMVQWGKWADSHQFCSGHGQEQCMGRDVAALACTSRGGTF